MGFTAFFSLTQFLAAKFDGRWGIHMGIKLSEWALPKCSQ